MHWSKLSTIGTSPIYGLRSHTSCLIQTAPLINDKRKKVLIFGGTDVTHDSEEHLMLFDPDCSFWYRPHTNGIKPNAHRSHSATVIDEQKLVTFGGGEGGVYFDHIYIFDTVHLNWSKPESHGSHPGPRRAHSSVLVGKNKIFVFGGGDGNKALNDTYVLDTDKMTWELLRTSGTLPTARGYHSATLFGENKIVIYGGSDGKDCFNDLFFFDTTTAIWSKKKVSSGKSDVEVANLSAPSPCFAHSTCLLGSLPILCVFGGHGLTTYTNDLRLINIDPRIDVAEMKFKRASGEVPSPRGYHTSVINDSRMVIFGGYDGKKCFNDAYNLDLGIYAHP